MQRDRRVATADDIARFELRLAQMERRLDHMERRLDHLELDVNAIDRRQRPYGDGSRDTVRPPRGRSRR